MRHLCLVPLLGGFLLASPSWASEPPAPTTEAPAATAPESRPTQMQIQVLSDKGDVVSTTSIYLPAGHGKVSATANSSRMVYKNKNAHSFPVTTFDGNVTIGVVGDDKSEWKISGEHIVVTQQTVDDAATQTKSAASAR